MTPSRRFGLPTVGWLFGLSASTVLSVVGGIIAGAVHGAWGWMGVPVILGVLFAAEFAAWLHGEVTARAREARNDELAAVIGGPLPDEVDLGHIDTALLERHLRSWSEEGR